MARPFSVEDAKHIISRHNRIIEGLRAVGEVPTRYQYKITEASDAMVAEEVVKILDDIPVEEISRYRKGLRVKALRDYGYNTIADIATASVYSLSSVYGISDDAAYVIKGIANEIASKAAQGIKIRLSTDRKTDEAGKLVTALHQYRSILPVVDECDELLSSKQAIIEQSIAELEPAIRPLGWLFSSKKKKAEAEEAYKRLIAVLDSEYGRTAEFDIALAQKIEKAPVQEAWDAFSSESIAFFNCLEEVNPGMLGNDDVLYGLPEDLARDIQEEAFFPDGLLCELRRYQEWGVKYILHQGRVLLGDEMGLGKTVQAIASMVSLRNTGGTHFVVVCPASVLTNWCREIREKSKLSVTKVHGAGREGALRSWIRTGGVAVTTYEGTVHFKLPEDFRFAQLVVDEAHYIKNPVARRTEKVKEISKHTDRVVFMTGTALENSVDEMTSLIRILNPRIASEIRGMEALSSAPQFRQAVAPVYYRRKREDVLTELPELIETKEWCTMGPIEEEAYENAILNRSFMESRRVSWNIEDLRQSSKACRLRELIQEAKSEGRKIIVFSFFLDTIRKISMMLGSQCWGPINGSVTPYRRQEILDDFDSAPTGSVLVAQIQSGGTGLNIQSASVVIICEPQLKPSVENQAISRAYRMGQTRNVLVYRLLCESSIDEKITMKLEEKQKIFDAFADKSVAAAESIAIDDRTLGELIQEEIDRINAENATKNKEPEGVGPLN